MEQLWETKRRFKDPETEDPEMEEMEKATRKQPPWSSIKCQITHQKSECAQLEELTVPKPKPARQSRYMSSPNFHARAVNHEHCTLLSLKTPVFSQAVPDHSSAS